MKGDGTMIEVKNDLLTNKYTEVYSEKDFIHNAPHRYSVSKVGGREREDGDGVNVLSHIKFQEGPIKEEGVNGVANEDLLIMVLDRLEHFNQTDFRCRENSMAITKIEEALLWLRKRTMGRESRGVEGTNEK